MCGFCQDNPFLFHCEYSGNPGVSSTDVGKGGGVGDTGGISDTNGGGITADNTEPPVIPSDATANPRVAVIGEDMGRVKPFASQYGYETMTDLPSELSYAEKLSLNRAWINARMDEGYTIVDLGPSPSNRYYPYITSPYYAMEQVEIAA